MSEDIKKMPEVIKSDLEKEQERIKLVADRAGAFGVVVAKEEIISKNSYQTGRLRQSISHDVTQQGSDLVLSLFSSVDYAETVHTGNVFNVPSLEDIKEWLIKKVALGHINIDKNRINTMAFFTQRKIENTKKIKMVNPFFENATKETLNKITEGLNDGV